MNGKRGLKNEICYCRGFWVYWAEIDREILLAEGHEIIILTRKPMQSGGKVKYVKWLEEGTLP